MVAPTLADGLGSRTPKDVFQKRQAGAAKIIRAP
ncbi:MAG: hypothetical protein JWR83_1835 [Aeromicrobium sp.]|jgi:hypothetical protein|nr:hypothetical protein [Aeromicrobium sp.]